MNSNLQNGCSGRRIAWDGSCSEIYHDIDRYGSSDIDKTYGTGDVVGVFVDTDAREVYFELNGQKIEKVIGYKGEYDLQPVIGFGYEVGEKYTISARYQGASCAW